MRSRWFSVLILLCVVGCGNAINYDGTLGQATPLTLIAGIPTIETTVDGEPRRLLIDSGSPLTFINGGGALPGLGTQAVALSAFGLTFNDYWVQFLDEGTTPLCAGPDPMGILGSDVLSNFALGLNYEGKSSALLAEGQRISASATEPAIDVPFSLLGGGIVTVEGIARAAGPTRIVLPVMVDGVPATAMVDTGASSTVVSQPLLDSIAAANRPTACCTAVSTISGLFSLPIVRLKSISVGSAELTEVPAFATERSLFFEAISKEVGQRVDVLIGGSFLRGFASTFDYGARVWSLARYTSPTDPDEFVLPGFTFCKAREASEGAYVVDVFQGTDAAAKGIVPGLQISAIDSQQLSGLTEAQINDLFRQAGVGNSVSLSLQGSTIDVQVERVLGPTP